jgi:hydroxymethylbilane synthase
MLAPVILAKLPTNELHLNL